MVLFDALVQEALAMQQARAALQVKRKGTAAGQTSAAHKAFPGPWDSAWDRPEDLELRHGLESRQDLW